ncbi:MAG TPA: NAD(+)/NADH kinase [Candidatus Limnocylindria bacterium]|nr:NAD(+)/NADH kinase [Candidatus Limnocylindria bacterium]
MIRAAGIVCKPIRETVCSVVPPLIEWLRARKIEVFVDNETQACIDTKASAVAREAIGAKIELLIVLGGDGTLLSAARALGAHKVPILAVNLGGLGFLTSVTLDELYPMLEQILTGQHRTGERMMLEAEIMRGGKSAERHTALNDAVANKGALARMLDFDVAVDGDHVGRYRADGLIVATPTGSTAYSLAAGGPIVHPELDAFVITPICPHMLTNRPLVIPDTSRVEIDFSAASGPVYVTLDGQIGIQLLPMDALVIRKSASKVVFVRPPKKTYFQILRNKLRWGER